MYVNPVQQTPLAYDPARQVLTPPAPIEPPLPPQPATTPVQQAGTPQDKFSPRDGGGGSQQDGGTTDQQKAAVAEQLHSAWMRLQQLKEEANQALLSGDARGAKDAAQEAAQVAVSIENLTGSTPDVALGPIEIAAEQISQHDASTPSGGQGSSGAGQNGSDTGDGGSAVTVGTSDGSAGLGVGGATASGPATVIDIARAGLGTARDVVDTAASIPSHPAADRASINGYKLTVLEAMAGVEAIAARVLGLNGAGSGSTNLIDIRA